MNYKKIYERLISRSMDRQRDLNNYYEKHHIIPKCMGGSDSSDNICLLTPEEHYIAHQLLVKIYPDNEKLVYASLIMTIHNSSYRMSNKFYGWLKRKFSIIQSTRAKELWQNYSDEQRIKHIENMSWSEERRDKHVEHMRDRYANTQYYDSFVTTMTYVNKDLQKRQKAGKKIKDRWKEEEYRKKTIEPRIGIVWWNNGNETKKSRLCPGDGWVRGRLDLKKLWQTEKFRQKNLTARKNKDEADKDNQ